MSEASELDILDSTIQQYQGTMVELEVTTDPTKQLHLLKRVGDSLSSLIFLKENIELMEAEIYYNIFRLWENHLTVEVKEQWDNDFYLWAKGYSLKGKQQVSPVTIDNKVRVFRMWLSEEKTIVPPPKVYLQNDEDEEDCEEVIFDVTQVPYSKLLVATGAANRGDMNEQTWGALINPSSTVGELKIELYKARQAVNQTPVSESESVIFNGGGILYFQSMGLTVAFAQLLYENSEHPLFAPAANRLLQMYGLKPDQELKIEMPNGNITGARELREEGEVVGVQIAHKGLSFADLTIKEAEQLFASLSEFLGKE